MIDIEFEIIGEPAHEPRSRARAIRGPKGNWIGQIYQPDPAPGTRQALVTYPDWFAVQEWRRKIQRVAKEYLPPRPLDCPVRVDVDFLFARPGYLLKPRSFVGEMRMYVKPDRDNLDKPLLDALKEIGFFKDDGRVCEGQVRKFYVAKGAQPGARVRIRQLEQNRESSGWDETESLFEDAI